MPEALADQYDYAAGQYLALRATIDGEEVRRSYSICRPPRDGRISVAIKRDLGGMFSNWANDTLQAGQSIDVMTPQGTFTSKLDELEGKQVVGIAAGSGITPVITMAHRVLEQSKTARFDLLYTNKSSLDVMFVEELAELKDRYPDRLALHHVLSREQRSAPIMSGRLDEEKLRVLLTSIIPTARVDEWVLCGPFAVSYTHLDVYKRQTRCRCAARHTALTAARWCASAKKSRIISARGSRFCSSFRRAPPSRSRWHRTR